MVSPIIQPRNHCSVNFNIVCMVHVKCGTDVVFFLVHLFLLVLVRFYVAPKLDDEELEEEEGADIKEE